jgi:hypothetical protein
MSWSSMAPYDVASDNCQDLCPPCHRPPTPDAPFETSYLALNRPISVYRLGETHIQSCGQSASAPRRIAFARLNPNTELRAERQRSAWEVTYRNRPIAPCKVFSPHLPGPTLRSLISNMLPPAVVQLLHNKGTSKVGSVGHPLPTSTGSPSPRTLNPKPKPCQVPQHRVDHHPPGPRP